MREICAVGIKCDGLCRTQHGGEYPKCPAYYLVNKSGYVIKQFDDDLQRKGGKIHVCNQ
jgi:hypothetical protein